MRYQFTMVSGDTHKFVVSGDTPSQRASDARNQLINSIGHIEENIAAGDPTKVIMTQEEIIE